MCVGGLGSCVIVNLKVFIRPERTCIENVCGFTASDKCFREWPFVGIDDILSKLSRHACVDASTHTELHIIHSSALRHKIRITSIAYSYFNYLIIKFITL